ncbi:MAG: hypothetical protein IT364_19000 [Candidatus Hydrogenedentes bacterium]|nr:hypothetical protein [Candidatus Hydrogenedentota bacterium]
MEDNFTVRLQQAMNQYRDGEFVGARISLEEMLHDDPRNPIVLTLLSQVEESSGNTKEAVQLAAEAVGLAPKSWHASLALFFALEAEGRVNEALDEIVRFLSVNKSSQHDELVRDITQNEENARNGVSEYLLRGLSKIPRYRDFHI